MCLSRRRVLLTRCRVILIRRRVLLIRRRVKLTNICLDNKYLFRDSKYMFRYQIFAQIANICQPTPSHSKYLLPDTIAQQIFASRHWRIANICQPTPAQHQQGAGPDTAPCGHLRLGQVYKHPPYIQTFIRFQGVSGKNISQTT